MSDEREDEKRGLSPIIVGTKSTDSKTIIILVKCSVFIVCVVSVYLFFIYNGVLRYPSDIWIEKKIIKLSEKKQIVRIVEFAPFEWEKVCVLFPYDTPGNIEAPDERLIYKNDMEIKFNIKSSYDSEWWLVFISGVSVVRANRLYSGTPLNKSQLKPPFFSVDVSKFITPSVCADRDGAILYFLADRNQSFFGRKK